MELVIPSPLRILLIDADSSRRAACRRALEKCGHEFALTEVDRAADGLTLARTGNWDCLLIDQNLPDFTGLEYLAELSEQGGIRLPAILLVPSDDPTVAARGLQLGASDVIARDGGDYALALVGSAVVRACREFALCRAWTEAKRLHSETRAQFLALLEQVPGVHYLASLDTPGKLLWVGEGVGSFGYSLEQWLMAPEGLLQWVHGDDRERVIDHWSETYGHHAPSRCEFRLICADGQPRWVRDEARVVEDESGQALFIQGFLTDVTEPRQDATDLADYRSRLDEMVAAETAELRREVEELAARNAALHAELSQAKKDRSAAQFAESRYRAVLEALGDGILALDRNGSCNHANGAAAHLLGVNCEELAGANLADVLSDQGIDYRGSFDQLLERGMPGRFTGTMQRSDGSEYFAEFSGFPMREDGAGNGAVLVVRDITEAQALTEQLSYEASHDNLTGLVNRPEFERRVNLILRSAREAGSEHALCFIDLDRFKEINDNYSHAAGDAVLRAFGRLMEGRLRQSDVLGRLGGDEFGLLLENCPLEQAWLIASDLREAVRNFRLSWMNWELSVGMSIGVVALNSASDDAASVLATADAACYAAKRRGSDRLFLAGAEGIGEPVIPWDSGALSMDKPAGNVIRNGGKPLVANARRPLIRVSG